MRLSPMKRRQHRVPIIRKVNLAQQLTASAMTLGNGNDHPAFRMRAENRSVKLIMALKT